MSKEYIHSSEKRQKAPSKGVIFEKNQSSLPEDARLKLLSHKGSNLFSRELELAFSGKSSREIAATVGYSATKVRKDLKKIETILEIEIPRAKPGRKRIRPERTHPKQVRRTAEEKQQCIAKAILLRKKGLTYTEIAEELSLAQSTVIGDLKDVEEVKDIIVKPKKRVVPPDPEKEAFIAEVAAYKKKTGLSNKRVGKRFGVSANTVMNYARYVQSLPSSS